MSAPAAPIPPALAEHLRILERLPAADRATVEQAIRAQFEEDQEEAQAQAARAAEEEDERIQAEELAAEIESQRQQEALREQEAHVAAAKTLVDLVKSQESVAEPKGKHKQVLQDDDLENSLDLLVATPSQKIRDRIKACDYIDLWHLTAEGMAVATRAKLSGDTTFELGTDGSFKLKDSVTGFKADQDLTMASWVTAVAQYVRIMQAEGVSENIVQSMIRLNYVLTNHPDFARHAAAVRLWHQHQRRLWVLSGTLNPEGKRFNLGKPNPKHFDELRLRIMEERASPGSFGGQSGSNGSSSGGSGGKRPPPNDFPSSAPRSKAARTIFRCFVCFASDSGHPFRTCAAKSRVDGKEQHAIRGPGGRVVFADSLKPICIDYQLKGCSAACRTGELLRFSLLDRHSLSISGLRDGFRVGIPSFSSTLVQPNHTSARSQPGVISTIIQRELAAGRYHGPYTASQLQSTLGHFQNSPLGLVPKGAHDWRLIQDFSWPRSGSSINSFLSSNEWPTTWGAARDVVRTLLSLPSTAQAAVRDVADAFRILLLHSSQWPGTIVRGDDDLFYVDLCLGFGLAPATGVWGCVADAISDICRAHGLGPTLKWVDDFIFFSVPLASLDDVNATRAALSSTITGQQSRGGVTFFAGEDGAEHVEDYHFPLRNHAASTPDDLIASLSAITAVTAPLGVPWKREKDVDFSPSPTYIGFQWFISERCVGLPDKKRLKYVSSIETWQSSLSHSLQEAQQLLGQLQHASFVVPHGRKRLGSLRGFVSSMGSAVTWARHRAGKNVFKDLAWWAHALARPDLRRSFLDDDRFDNVYIACDASTSFGVGIFCDGEELSLPVRPGWATQGRDIAWLEAVAMEVALLVAIGRGISDCRLRILTDNTSVFFSERSGYSRNSAIMEVLARIRDLEAQHNLELVPILVPSAHNLADEPSRAHRPSLAQLRRPELPASIRAYFE
ncbi:hypothetical protein A4X13_0g8170 [Tilletia indica]|uniref:Reverse transcriptase domain-containing protein n=1 Tax=Tilletia indica TaxID=43049 RepID=A0A8T8SH32_9BASI|nr:hypothetical protein A4X13_0g8170 [Tilletia indica]